MKATDRFLYTSLKEVGNSVIPKIMTNISVRDYVAIEAMDSVTAIVIATEMKDATEEGLVELCYRRADAMIAESEK